MRVRLHLVAAPWAYMGFPSLSIATLKAYIDRELSGRVDVFTYSQFLSIPYQQHENRSLDFHKAIFNLGEYLYLLLYYARYLKGNGPLKRAERESLFDQINAPLEKCLAGVIRPGEWLESESRVSEKTLGSLERATMECVDREILPNLISDGVNVIGFTLNFQQVYSSLFIMRYLEEKAKGRKLLFLFGGNSATQPHTVDLFRRLGVDGYCVFGEGEHKLKAVLEDLLEPSGTQDSGLSRPIPGVFSVQRDKVDLYQRDESLFKTQISKIDDLPEPDLREYFDTVAKISKGDPIMHRLLQPWLMLEGSRGCFAHCKFCNLNSQWDGYRAQSGKSIFERTLRAVKGYGLNRVMFVDTACDPWAEKFADEVIVSGEKLNLYMCLRVHHPERFWAKLAAAGATSIQLGIEALSAPLLAKMNKGTNVVQNVVVQKYLVELGIGFRGNLITHYPGSTVEDVRETERVIGQIAHLGEYKLSPLWLGVGSPMFEELGPAERDSLMPDMIGVSLPEKLKPYVGFSAGFQIPRSHALSGDVNDEWDAFCSRYFSRPESAVPPRMTVTREADGLCVVDQREGDSRKEFHLTGLTARIYDECHAGRTSVWLVKRLLVSEEAISRELEFLAGNGLTLELAGHHVSLAVRPRHELLAGIYDAHQRVRKAIELEEVRA